MFNIAKTQLLTALKQVFNLEARIDTKAKSEYQDCVLYTGINTIKAITKDETNVIYFITGTVFLNVEAAYGYSVGLLTTRVANFNKVDGLYFAKNEVIQAPFTTLNFEFYSKSLQLKGVSKEVIKDINNKVQGNYK